MNTNDPDMISKIRDFVSEKSIAGFVVSAWWREGLQAEQFSDIISELALQRIPVAILDRTGELRLSQRVLGQRPVRIFKMGSRSAGEAVGRMLLGLRHREVAYFSPEGQTSWSRLRFEGIRKVYAGAGHAYQTTLFGTELGLNHSFYALVLAACDIPESAIRKIFGVRLHSEFLMSLLDETARVRKKGLAVKASDPAIQRIRADVLTMAGMTTRAFDPDIFVKLRLDFFFAANKKILAISCRPIFERALASSRATAWVCRNDELAIAAYDFLRTRQIAVPRQISLVGFDNTTEAFRCGITSVDSNIPIMVQRILLFVTSAPRPGKFRRQQYVELPVIIVERTSTARSVADTVS